MRYWVTMSVHSLRPAALRCPGGFGRGFPGNAASSKGISSEFWAFWALLPAIIASLAGHYSKTLGAFGTSTTIHILIFSTTRPPPRPEGGLVLKKSTPPAIDLQEIFWARPLGQVTPGTT